MVSQKLAYQSNTEKIEKNIEYRYMYVKYDTQMPDSRKYANINWF